MLAAFSLKAFQGYKRLVYPTVCAFLLLHSYPYFSRDYVSHINTEKVHSDNLFPEYYSYARIWSNLHKDDNVISIPIAYYSLYLYRWYDHFIGNHYDYGGMPDIIYHFNSIGRTAINYYEHRQLFRNYDNRLLSIFNVDYVLNQADLDVTSYASSLDSLVDLASLNGAIEEKPVRQFGKLFLYKVKDEFYLPRVFAEAD